MISSSHEIIFRRLEANSNGSNKVLELIMEMHLYHNGNAIDLQFKYTTHSKDYIGIEQHCC